MLQFILGIVFIFTSPTSGEWELVDEKDNIKVYTRKTDESKYEQIKIIAKIKSPISEIVKALEDVDYHQEWVYETNETRFLNKRSYNDFDYYAKMNMPFPIKDRDIVINYNRSQEPESKVVNIISKAAPTLLDKQKKLIRIETFLSTYTLKPLPNGWVKVEYFMAADPGGKLPAWVVNLFTTKGPVATMESLITLIDSGYYRGKKAEDIID
ncbi:MAG: hypothetical protein KJN84_05595 [Bacteroidia bacterium]|nr:hypothetical protein [Bacteroidia bacterium]